MNGRQGSRVVTIVPEPVEVPPLTPQAGASVALDGLPMDQFEALIRMGRARGGLTQDDVMTVLRTVELSADLISDVVARIREAGIEFTYDTGETTVVPMTGAVADDLSDRLREGFPVLADESERPAIAVGVPPARIVALDPSRPTTRQTGADVVPNDGPDVPATTGRAPVKKERAPRRTSTPDGYSDTDGFRGSAADPVHMYLKEIGKVKLLDAALEVELAERILAGNEAAARLARFEGGTGESYPGRAADRVLVRRGQSAKEALIEANLGRLIDEDLPDRAPPSTSVDNFISPADNSSGAPAETGKPAARAGSRERERAPGHRDRGGGSDKFKLA